MRAVSRQQTGCQLAGPQCARWVLRLSGPCLTPALWRTGSVQPLRCWGQVAGSPRCTARANVSFIGNCNRPAGSTGRKQQGQWLGMGRTLGHQGGGGSTWTVVQPWGMQLGRPPLYPLESRRCVRIKKIINIPPHSTKKSIGKMAGKGHILPSSGRLRGESGFWHLWTWTQTCITHPP